MWVRFRILLRSLFRRRDLERDMHDELRFHIESYASDLVCSGLSPDEAMRRARIEFGAIDAKKDDCRASLGLRLWDELRSDVRYALRVLRKTPGFALVAIVTLALGIGADSAVFSVINAVLLRPLPFCDPQQLIFIGGYDTRHAATQIPARSLSYPDFLDIRTRSRTIQDVAMYSNSGFTLTGVGEPMHVKGDNVSAGTFRLLGIRPALGRDFLPDEDQPGHHVAIVSDAFWRSRLNADPGAIGRSIGLNGREFTIIGVMPPGFQFPLRQEPRDVWVTFSLWAGFDNPITAQRGSFFGETIARLKPGVTLAQANADLASIARALSSEYPETDLHTGLAATREIDHVVGRNRTSLLLLFAAVGLLMLIACINVTGLLLARANTRTREIAVRTALGARRTRIVRQLVTEATVLALIASGFGLLLARWFVSAMLRLYPANLPRAEQVGIDVKVFLFATALGALTGVVFGLLPALQVSAPNLAAAMGEAGRTTSAAPRQNRARSALVLAEVALGVILLTGASLLLQSLVRLNRANLGMNPDHVLTATFDLSETRYNTAEQMDRLIGELLARARTLPGVVNASATMPLPLGEDGWTVTFNRVDHPLPSRTLPSVPFYLVRSGYFETMQIPLLRGRVFDSRDQRDSQPVAIITESLAKKYFAGEDPIGRRIWIGAAEGPARVRYQTREIVGIVGDIRTSDVAESPHPSFYVPQSQLIWSPPTLVVRTAGDPDAVTSAVRKTLLSLDPESPLHDVRTMNDYLALDLGRARFQAVLFSAFASLALLLTSIGLYGVVSYVVVQRTHEFGVRIALGASPRQIVRMVLGRGIGLTLAGIVCGVAGALALGPLLASVLYGVSSHDPLTFVCVSFMLAAVALLASYVPARRAARVDPMVALRYE